MSLAVALVAPAISMLGATPTQASVTTSPMVIMLAKGAAGSSGSTASALAAIASSITNSGGRVTSQTSAPLSVSANVSASEAALLKVTKGVLLVAPNAVIHGPTASVVPHASGLHISRTPNGAVDANGNPVGQCGTQAAPELDPEAVTAINAPSAWSAGFTGTGVSVAFMAEGIDTTNPDFQRNGAYSGGQNAGSPVITAQPDFSGDGNLASTGGGEAFLDASSIGAQGNQTYDLYNYPDNINNPGCYIKVVGVAPGASMTSLKVFGKANLSTTSGFVEAIQYAIANGVKVLNESFGGNPMGDSTADAIKIANDAAVAAGVTVVVSSGDAGPTNTIGSPASDPNVIAVGASTTHRAYAQDFYGGYNAPGVGNGSWINNNISGLSSGGMTQSGRTVDLVAPGDLNWALCSTNPTYTDCGGFDLTISGGTSESAPLTAGAAADVIQAYRSSHAGAYPTPDMIKHILMSTATDINAPATEQGVGLLNVGAAVQLAKSIGAAKGSASGSVLMTSGSLTLSGKAGQKTTSKISLQNTSNTAASVSFSARQLIPSGNETGSFNLDPSVTSTQPTFPIWSGAQETYQTTHFTVPAGTDHVSFASDFTFTGQSSVLHVALFDPSGNYAGYSESQGLADHTNIEVASPAAGTWTAVFFTVSNTWCASCEGTSGTIQWEADYANWASIPVNNSLSLGAGKTGSTNVVLYLPNVAGDYSASIQASVTPTGAGSPTQTISIPVTERVAVTIAGGAGNFRGVITGGNGRAGVYGQANTFNFPVAAGVPNIEADIELANFEGAGYIAGDQIVGALIDPSGNLQAYDTNYTVDQSGSEVALPYLSLYAANPVAGTWQLELWVANPVVGNTLQTPFHGQILMDAVSVKTTMPNSSGTTVSMSNGAMATVSITNNGLTPMFLSTDARSTQSATYSPYSSFDIFGQPSTMALNHSWVYYVPTQTSSVTATLSSSVNATFDVGSWIGDPEFSVLQNAPDLTTNGNSLTYAPAGGVESGVWQQGWAYATPTDATAVDATQTATAGFSFTAKAFDDSVTTSIGDLQEYLMGFGANQGLGAIVFPGQTMNIQVAINPTAAVGTTVTGNLSLETGSIGNWLVGVSQLTGTSPFFSEIAQIPYSYTVGS